TLHPKIHGGILGRRDKATHQKEMTEHGILPIGMVVVNLYVFEDTVSRGCNLEEAIENIDIGGPTMIRGAAKNYKDVTVVVDPEDYNRILEEMREKDGALSLETRFYLAKKVFQLTTRYEGAISNYLGKLEDGLPKREFPETLSMQFEKVQDLRYGENPHQKAAFYGDIKPVPAGFKQGIDAPCVSNAKQLHGKELSFNNILDLDSAIEMVKGFSEPAVAIIKHNNPCGVAISKKGLLDAYLNALACDRTSAFGGIVGLNRVVDVGTAKEVGNIFLEAIIAPGFDEGALEVLKEKKNIRLLQLSGGERHGRAFHGQGVKGTGVPFTVSRYDFKRVIGGLLVQTRDTESVVDLKTVTKRGPTEKELEDLLFAWQVCKYVKSNAIIFARDGQTIGIGAGQMSRVDSVRIGIMKAGDAGLLGTDLKSVPSVMASDAFFPFRDAIDKAAEAGITAIIQPGGSIRDKDVIQAADEHNIAMVFTGMRHFRH
ncbi:MAG: bifunctional phosphoribosylaminoimidazolecarboxamide formyltransferase/IMP cyclohydrolase, partial [Deltaproteobacteria bacterium]|nr:bifunctional phosphoribosylaminoimidazolecarboxamide formyltransferase/IMP cyclohydrolase [Deltaproteobacteria bacterium]